MTLEYQAITDVVSNRGRFSVYEGESRGHFDIVCKCKPTSAKDEHSLGLCAKISKTRRNLFCLEIVNSEVRFFGTDQTDMIAFALRLIEMIQGENRNMLIDLVSGPVRIASPHYRLAEEYDVYDNADDALSRPDPGEDEDEVVEEEQDEVVEAAPVELEPASTNKVARKKAPAKRKPAVRRAAKPVADLTFDDVL